MKHLSFFMVTVLMLVSFEATADVKDIFHADVEIYGKPSFLMRINKHHKFDITIHSQKKSVCEIDEAVIVNQIAATLKKSGHNMIAVNEAAYYTIHVEYYSGVDINEHCMFGYDLSLSRPNMRTDAAGELLARKYNYLNEYHIMKLTTMLHIEKHLLNDTLIENVGIAASRLMTTLENMQQDIKKTFKLKRK